MFSEITTLVVSSVQYDIFLMFKYKLLSWCSRSNFNKKKMQQQFKLFAYMKRKTEKSWNLKVSNMKRGSVLKKLVK